MSTINTITTCEQIASKALCTDVRTNDKNVLKGTSAASKNYSPKRNQDVLVPSGVVLRELAGGVRPLERDPVLVEHAKDGDVALPRGSHRAGASIESIERIYSIVLRAMRVNDPLIIL